MKKRIIALVLVAVMSILSLVSCGGFDFAKEDLSKYADFNYAEFKKALASIEIEDGDFTTNEETRQKKVLATVYDKIADAIVAAATDEDKNKSGAIGAGDVLYYVYYAVDAEGNVYFYSEMDEKSMTASSTKAAHVIELGGIDVEDEDADEIKKLIKQNLVADADLADYVYSMITATEIKEQVKEEFNAAKEETEETEGETEDTPNENDATTDSTTEEDALEAAIAEALKVKVGDRVVISYSRSYKNIEEDSAETTVTESAVYEAITVDEANPFASKLVGATIDSSVAIKVDDSTSFDVEIDGVTYTYSNVKILYKVESEGKPIATFNYTYTTDKNVTPDNVRSTGAGKVNLKDKELTYYVYPVYSISVPAANEIKGSDVLEWITGAKIATDSFDVFEDEGYVYKEEGKDDEKLTDLVKDLVNIYNPDEEDNDFYADGTDLKDAHDKYLDKVEEGGSSPTSAQKEEIDAAKKIYNDLQKAEAKKIYAKIDVAVKGEESASDAIIKEYTEDTYHDLKIAYDTNIVESVEIAIWKLVQDSVKVNSYPEKLVKEYKEHIYDTYEYEYYKGTTTSDSTTGSSVSNYETYENLNAYIIKQLNVSSEDQIDSAIEAKAKASIEPLIKIYVVAKACEADALAVLPGFVKQDVDAGKYDVNVHELEETYGDAAADKIADAEEQAEETKTYVLEDAERFIINDQYIKAYKKRVGNASYDNFVKSYGEINLRAYFQFDKLFYYLTYASYELDMSDGHGHEEYKYTTIDGVDYIDFKTVKYTIKAEADAE